MKLITTLVIILFTQATFALDRTQIAATANEVTPLLNGQSIPNVWLKNVDGESVNLVNLVSRKPSVIVFYRGGWCPFCSTQLAGLNEYHAKLEKLGYQIIAISPDPLSSLNDDKMQTKDNIVRLSDRELKAIRAFGLAYFLDDKTAGRYEKALGDKLVKVNNRIVLPAPAVYLSNTDGQINFQYVNPNFRVRVQPELLYHAAKLAK